MPASRHIAPLLLMALVACNKPSTVSPEASDSELKQEQAAQEQAAQVAAVDKSTTPEKTFTAAQLDALAVRMDPIATKIETAAKQLCTEMRGAKGKCSGYRVELDPAKGLNAYADGSNVVLNAAMVDFARNDTHLAFVMAHEFGHNIMGHIQAQKDNGTLGTIVGSVGDLFAITQGVNTHGALGKFGENRAMLTYSPEFEAEADYVGLYILARAGYPIEQAPDFWRLMSAQQPKSIYVTSTHPNNAARTIAMEKTIKEIRAKQAAGEPLIPNIKPKA